jgi:hypothetical protein
MSSRSITGRVEEEELENQVYKLEKTKIAVIPPLVESRKGRYSKRTRPILRRLIPLMNLRSLVGTILHYHDYLQGLEIRAIMLRKGIIVVRCFLDYILYIFKLSFVIGWGRVCRC